MNTSNNDGRRVQWPPLSAEEHERLDAQMRLYAASAEQYHAAGCQLAEALLSLMARRTRATVLDAAQALAQWNRVGGTLPRVER